MKNSIILGLKEILIMIIMFIGMAISSVIVGVHTSQSSNNSVTPLLIFCFLNTVILTVYIINSKMRGLKLIGTTFIIFWGIQYFMTQIETLYFDSAIKMPLLDTMQVVIMGAISIIISSLFAVLILGKFKKKCTSSDDENTENTVKVSFAKLLPNMAILAFCYAIIYFLFGYFVAWQFPALREYYTGSTTILNVFQHMANQLKSDPILPLFQLLRGLLWSGLSVIIITSLNTKCWKTYIITGLLFSVVITSPLILPNAYMPAPVRLGHSFELFTSMFAFGILSIIVFKSKFDINVLDNKKSY
jgi:hypothetical protein